MLGSLGILIANQILKDKEKEEEKKKNKKLNRRKNVRRIKDKS